MILIREKHLDARQILCLAGQTAKEPLPIGSLLMLSERMDNCPLTAGLDGVHLPEHSCPALRLRNASPAML